MTKQDFLVKVEFDIKELFYLCRDANRSGVKLVLVEGILSYKEHFENCKAVTTADDPKIKSFIAYTLDAFTLLCGVALGHEGSVSGFFDILSRMEEIRREYEPKEEQNREYYN